MDTFYRFLAVLGACSWLLPLFTLIRTLVLKPKLSIYSHDELEIGYSTFGPIVNINLAFSAERKQVLINQIDLELKHQNNETHKFTWQWFEEKLSEVESQEGMPILYKKNQKAIALKVLQETLVEKKIGFNEIEFKRRNRELFGATSQIYNNLILNKQNVVNLKSTKEYNELTDYYKNSFIWKVGKYSAKIKVFIGGIKESSDHQLEFQLTGLDIKNLESNIKICVDITENHFIIANPDLKINWRWVNPLKI